MDKILVSYLFTKYDSYDSILKFFKNYFRYKSGVKHKLLVCFKLLDKQKVISLRSLFKNINYIEFIDPSNVNDYDFGSYKRIAQKYPRYKIFFLNSHSYPIVNNWLKKIVKHYRNKSLIGCSGSYESKLSSLKIKKFYKFFGYIINYINYFFKFNSFPNPHIRTTGFLINGTDFLNFTQNRKFDNKEDAWVAESGKNSLTNFFKKKNFNIFLVNSDGVKFNVSLWDKSETYCHKKSSKSLISDNHIRKYSLLKKKEKKISQQKVWGKIL